MNKANVKKYLKAIGLCEFLAMFPTFVMAMWHSYREVGCSMDYLEAMWGESGMVDFYGGMSIIGWELSEALPILVVTAVLAALIGIWIAYSHTRAK